MASNSKLYKQQKIEGTFDAIIIGSGMGGMATGAFLAKKAKSVGA